MSKISELGPITGANTRTEDLFVIVNLIQGDDGTKNITRKELVQALQYEIFDRITITGGSISNVVIFNTQQRNNTHDSSIFNNGTINTSILNDVEIYTATGEDVSLIDSRFETSVFANGDIVDSNANNIIITNSQFNDSTGNNDVFTNSRIDYSEFNQVTIEGGTANNLVLTNITIDQLVLEDAFISNSQIITTDFSNGSISDSTVTDVQISNSTIISTDLDDVDITNSRFSNGQIWDTEISNSDIRDTNLDNVIITNSVFANGSILDTTANNMTITNSDFSDGTGNNNIFTNTTLDTAAISNATLANSAFTGTMDNVVANNLQITSSSADGLSQTQSTFDSGTISRSTFEDGVIDQSQLVDFDMELHKVWEPNMDEDSYFAIKNVKTNQTEQITYRQFFNEISKSTEKALKVHVAADGDDHYPGTILQPVRTLKRAAELALEKAGGSYDRNDINNAVHISVGPGVYWVDDPIWLPDDCSMSSTAGQYATLIRKKPGYERTNGILVGSGNYVQGFAYMDFEVDNFDYPEGGFAIAYRPNALLRRSPYIRDSSQLSNFRRLDVEPPLSPFNSKGTIADLGQEIFLEAGHSGQALWEIDDEVTFSSGATGYLSWNTDVDSDSRIYVRNLKGKINVGDHVYSQRGGTGIISEIGIDDFPNRLVGRGGGCLLADRRVLDPDSLYTYVLCFGFTPRSQNGMGYVARDGAGVNGIGSLSIFVRTAFYALNGGQMTLNNSGTQFGDISMRSKGNTQIIRPADANEAYLLANTDFADVLEENIPAIVDNMLDYLTANTASGGLGYQGYNADKCYRDTGIIVDNTGYDVALDTNYWGRLSGITYSSPISQVVKAEQLTETLGANEHLKDQINYIFRNANTAINDRVNRSIGETLNILENGEAAASPIIFADTGNVARTNAREIIQGNKELIIQGMVDWIDNNPNFFAYDSATCRRDIEQFILPAVKYDTMLDTNYNSVTAGNAYYFKQAGKVLQNQREETIGAYERLRNETDKLLEANTAVGAVRAYDRFNQILDILGNTGAKYTPTNVTYNPATGEAVFTIGLHNLSVGRYITLAPESLTFSCDTDGNVLEYSHPRTTDPAYNAALPILSVTSTEFTVNVGATGYKGVHTFVKADRESVSVVGNEITFSDNVGIPADNKNARKQLQANKTFIQDYMMDWADNNFFMYDSEKCQRDTQEYIIPAIQRDMITGTTFNAIQSGIAYRQGITSAGPDSQLTETVGAFTHLKGEVAGVLTDPVTIGRSNAAFDEFINIMKTDGAEFTPTDATYNPVTGESVITIPAHGLQVGDQVILAPESLTFACANTVANTVVEISHPRATDPAYESPVQITAATTDTITVYVGGANGYTGAHSFVRASRNAVKQHVSVNASWTPTDATYDPVTGESVITIGSHDIQVGDKIILDKESLTFECANTVANTVVQISHPRVTDPAFNTLIEVTAVSADTITIEVGNANGYTGAHTFVSATANAVKTARFPDGRFTPTNATYDPVTGLSTITIGKHELEIGDTIKIMQEALTFECGSPAELISHPRTTDPAFDVDLTIIARTPTTITVNVGDANGYTGVHTFVKAKPFAIKVTTPYNGKLTPINGTYDPVTGDMTFEVGQHNLTVGKWISIAPESVHMLCDRDGDTFFISHPRPSDPAYKQPVRITSVTGTTFTVNVGNAGGYTAEHFFNGADVDCIDTNAIYWTDSAKISQIFTPETAAYDPATGDFVITITGHGLTTDDHIEMKPNSFVFSCANTVTGEITEISNPRIGEPYYGVPLPIASVTTDTVTVNVGSANGYTGAHTFVRADADAVYKVTATQDGTFARQQLQANKKFIQDSVDSWIRENYFVYNKETCQRDTGLILDAVARDVLTGSNLNSVFHGLAYRSGNATTDSVIANELTETAGALTWLKGEIGTLISGTEADAAFDEIIDIMVNGTANADVITFGTTYVTDEHYEARAALQANKQFIIDETTAWIAATYPTLNYDSAKCERDVGYFIDAVSWDMQHESNAATVLNARMYYDKAASILPSSERPATAEAFKFISELAGQIVRNEVVVNLQSVSSQVREDNTTFTPTDATYDPVTGISELTIPGHSYVPGDRISLAQESITFECANTVANTTVQISHPRVTDPSFNTPITILSVTANTVTIEVGNANGYTGAHTFVSAANNAVQTAMMQPTYTPTNATYDPVTGISVITIGTHRFETGDWIIMDQESLTFSCANTTTGVITNISHPRVTDPTFNSPVQILETTATTIKLQVGKVPGGYAGLHTFVSATPNCVRKASNTTIANKVKGLFKIVSDVVRANDFAAIPAIQEPIALTTNPTALLIAGSKEKYQTEIVDYIREQYNGLGYNIALCYRDIGYIVDAISEDLEYGGNAGTINAASYYWDNALNILPRDQREPTRLTFQHLGEVVEDVITETTVLPTFGTSFTPTDATYDPATGLFVATIGSHDLAVGDYIWMEQESITFECANTVANTTVQISHPRTTDPAFESPIQIIGVTATTISMNVGDANGYTGAHTFVSADANAIKEVTRNFTKQSKAGFAGSATIAAAGKALANVIADLVDDEPLIEGYIGSRDDYFKAAKQLPEVTGNPAMSPSRTFARKSLQKNKEFIQDEIINFISDEYFVFDSGKCARDTGYILNAVRRDVQTGADYNSRIAGKVYRANTRSTNVVVDKQLAETVEAVQYLQRDIESRLQGTALDRATAAFNNIIDAMVNDYDIETANYNFGVANVGSNNVNASIGLQLNRAFLRAEAIAWIAQNHGTLVYDQAKCERDIGYMVDAVSYDIRHNSNVAMLDVARLYFENGLLSVLPEDQRAITAELYVHLAAVAEQVATKSPVTVTPGNTVPQVTTGFGPVAGAVAQKVQDTWTIVADIIASDSYEFGAPAVVEAETTAGPATGYDYEDEATTIANRVSALATGVTQYLKETYNYLEYSQVKCRRDVGYMVDAISHDIQYGGNSAMWNAAQIYFVNAVNLLPIEQREPTRRAFTHLGEVIYNIIRNDTVPMRTGKSWTPSNATYDPLSGITVLEIGAHNLKIGDYILLADGSLTFECGGTGLTLSHPRAKEAASGKPLKVIGLTGTTITVDVGFANGYTGVHTFVSASKNAVTHVVSKYAQDKTTQTARRYIAREARDLAWMIANVAYENNPTTLPYKVEPSVDWIQAGLIADKKAIDVASTDLTKDMINFITREYKGLSYPKQTCRRDVGIIVDALSHDVNYSTNYATRLNANMYFSYGTSVLPYDQRQQTADFYAKMASLVSNIVQEIEPGQDLTEAAATPAEGAYVADLVRIIEEAIRRDSLDAVPDLVEPDTSWIAEDLIWAGNEIDNNLDELADDVTTWLNNEYNVLDYNKAKCYRDGHYLLDAFSHDLNYGGNIASKWNADFYFWNNVFRIPENQRVPTGQAYRELGRLCREAILGKLPGQIIPSDVGTQEEADHAYELGLIFYNSFYNNSPKELGATVLPDFDWEDNTIFKFSRDILKIKREQLQKEVQRFIGAQYKFIDLPKTKRDATNVIRFLSSDFRWTNPALGTEGSDQGARTVVAALFNIDSKHVFPVFNPPLTFNGWQDLRFKGTLANTGARDALTGMKRNDAYIIPHSVANDGINNPDSNNYYGVIHYWNGTVWQQAGENNVDLLYSFYKAWENMRDYITANLTPDLDHTNMINELFNTVIIGSTLRPNFLTFGSLVESIAHQFNGASAGVNRNALPLNFRNLGAAISATASVLSEDGGRIRWSGADELNNQYFARGLRINGRTGRIEGRPFTSSVRKLARRASNSRAAL